MNFTPSLLQADLGQYGLWPSVARLLSLRVRIWINAFRHAKLRRKIGTIVLMLVVISLMVGLFMGSALLLRFMRSPELAEYVDPKVMLNTIPTLVLTAAFFVTLMTNFGVLLQALYLSRDMDFLVTAPLPMRAVFLAKLLEAVLPNFALFCAFTLPVLFGLGVSNGYTVLYYPLLIIMLILLALAASGLASILVMAVVRVVPARRVAEVLGVVGALVSVLCGQTGNLINAMDLNRSDVGSGMGMLSRMDVSWSPMTWAGHGLIAVGEARWAVGFGLSLLTMLLAGAIFTGTLFLAEQLYYTGWSSMQGSVRKKKAAPKNRTPQASRAASAGQVSASDVDLSQISSIPATEARVGWLARMVPSPVRGMIRKDFSLLRRDPRNVSNLITPLILGFVMLFTTQRGANEAESSITELRIENLQSYVLIFLAIFVGWILMLNLSTLAFSREGKNYWILKTAPVGSWHLLSAKYIISFLPSVVFSLGYLLLAYLIRGANYATWPFSALVVTFCMAGATGIALSFGVAGANLEWDSPQRQRLSGSAGCLSFIAVSGFLMIDLALFVAPVIVWQVIKSSLPWYAYVVSIALGVTASLAATIIPLIIIAPRLARIGEKD